MTFTIKCSDKFRHDWESFIIFVQQATNRLAFGYPRYEAVHGGPHKSNKYMTRMGKELEKYRATGNSEHLRNIFNYAWLETRAPENSKFQWNTEAESATRPRERSDFSTYIGHSGTAMREPFAYRWDGD